MTTTSMLERRQAAVAVTGARRDQPGARRDQEAFRGASHMLPMLAGLAPFGVLVGTAVAASDVPAAGWAATWLIFGGSAHLALLQVLQAGGGAGAAAITALLINARLLVFSASFAPHWQSERRRFRLLAAAAIVDPLWALTIARYKQPGSPAAKRAYYTGAAVTLAIGWGVAVTAGALAGGWLPQIDGLAVAVPVSLVGLVVPSLTGAGNRPARAAALAAGATALATQAWSPGIGMLAALAAAVTTGIVTEVRR